MKMVLTLVVMIAAVITGTKIYNYYQAGAL
jgi:hypothetical protein